MKFSISWLTIGNRASTLIWNPSHHHRGGHQNVGWNNYAIHNDFLRMIFFEKVTELGTKLATLLQHLWHKLKKVNNLWDSDFLVIISFRNSIIWCLVERILTIRETEGSRNYFAMPTKNYLWQFSNPFYRTCETFKVFLTSRC